VNQAETDLRYFIADKYKVFYKVKHITIRWIHYIYLMAFTNCIEKTTQTKICAILKINT